MFACLANYVYKWPEMIERNENEGTCVLIAALSIVNDGAESSGISH